MKEIDKKYINKLKNTVLKRAEDRRVVIKESGDALHHAKRAIFAIHKGNLKEAESKLKESRQILSGLIKKYSKDKYFINEGSYKAAVEEYVEAHLFYNFVNNKSLGEIKDFEIEPEVYIGGLCDLPGEVYRYAIKAATNKDIETVKRCVSVANEVVGELIEFNLTSYLRNKFDQAKQAAHKVEQVVYEVSLRS